MKDGVILVNNARGQLIHEQGSAAALNSGKVGAAALDVVSTEPIRSDNPLLQAKNCISPAHLLGPHRKPPAHPGLHHPQRPPIPLRHPGK